MADRTMACGEEEDWQCGRCTLVNARGAARCEACGAPCGAAEEASASESQGDESDYDGLDDDDEAAHTVAIHVARRLWEETEARRIEARDASARSGGGAISFDDKRAAKAQIFTSQACFRMLSEELFKLKAARSPRLGGEAEGNDVHVWRVSLGGFETHSPLGADLRALAARFPGCGADCVVLRLRFKADLFPFFPPSVELVRPRLHGAARSALASHPLLRLSNWDPMTGAAALLERLRRFLERTARVDMDCAANDPRGAPQGAHSDPISLLHGALVQLGALHSLTAADDEPLHAHDAAEEGAEAAVAGARAPAAACLPAMPRHLQPQRLGSGAAAMDTEPPAALKSEGEEEEEEGEEEDGDDELDMMEAVGAEAGAGSPGGGRKRKLAGWAPGTGYGYDGGGGRVEDRWDPAKTKAAQEAQDEATQRLTVGVTELVHAAWAAGEPTAAAAAAVVSSSVLAPFLARELRGLSIMDMAARLPYYTALVRCLLAVAHSPAACRGGGFEAVLAVLAQVEAQAHMFTRLSARSVAERQQQGESSGAAGGSALPPRAAIAPQPVTSAAAAASAAASAAAGASEAEALALVVQAAETLRATLRAPRPRADAPAAPAAAEEGDEVEAYVRALAPLGLDACATLSGEHHYRKDASDNASPAQVRRVAKECAALAALLPCSPSSSVFVRAEEASTSLWRALVTGPEGTPYAGGTFLFDFFFPASYPSTPPKVNLCTTGGGKIRFNPNLYNCGKVCLSLLGTWHGAKGEGWDPNASSALQVLVSIQSLIFVAEPFFNEPGYERQMGTPAGDEMSRSYNAPLREATIRYAMLEPLRKPTPEFETVIRNHFRLRRAAILRECRGWVSEARAGERTSLAPLVEQLAAELDKL